MLCFPSHSQQWAPAAKESHILPHTHLGARLLEANEVCGVRKESYQNEKETSSDGN